MKAAEQRKGQTSNPSSMGVWAEARWTSDHYIDALQVPWRLSDLALKWQGARFGWWIKKGGQFSTIEGEWNSRTTEVDWQKDRTGISEVNYMCVCERENFSTSNSSSGSRVASVSKGQVDCGGLQPIAKKCANLVRAPPCTGNSLKCHIKMDLI